MLQRADNFQQTDLDGVAVNPDAQEAIDGLAEQIQELLDTTDPLALLKRIFCQTLNWQFVNQPIPANALPQDARDKVIEGIILAKCDQLPLCFVRMAKSELMAADERHVMGRLTRVWPGALVAFSSFGQTEIDFCYRGLDDKTVRICLDRDLFGPSELAQAIYAMRAFDLKTEEPLPQLEVAEQLERQLKVLPRRIRRRPKIANDPFFRELPRHELLTKEQEHELRRRYAPGLRDSARDKLVLSNLRLVVWIAYRYRHSRLGWDDLLQEGVCGLLKAADKFDPSKGFKFSTYATWWVMQTITRAIADKAAIIRLPVHIFHTVHRFRRTERDLMHKCSRPATVEELAKRLKISVVEARQCQKAAHPPTPEGFTTDRGWWAAASPKPGDGEDNPTFNTAATAEVIGAIEKVLSGLDLRMRKVICGRFGLNGQEEQTLEQIGDEMNITRERVRQIEKTAMNYLQHPIRKRMLGHFISERHAKSRHHRQSKHKAH